MYDNAPLELLKIPLGTELTAKVKITSKDIHEGERGRQGAGFDCISITAPDTTDTARDKGKEIADTVIKPKGR